MSNRVGRKNNDAFHWAWIILAVCFCNLFVNYSVRLGYGVILPEMIRDLSFSRTAGGSIYNSYLFVYLVLTPFTGFLTDRFGARRVIAVCSLILGTGVILMGTVQGLVSACLFYAIVGLGATGMWTPVITVVQRWFSPHKRGLALGIISTGYGLGFATMGAVFPWIVHHFNWRYAWYFLGFAALVMFLLNSVLLRSDPELAGFLPWGEREAVEPNKIIPEQETASMAMVFKSKPFWIIGFSYFYIAYSLYGITTFMVDFAKTEMGLPLAKASFLATIHGIGQIVGVLTVLPLSDYLGRRKIILISNFTIAITLTGIIFISHSWLILYILVGILAIFYGVTFPIYGACAGDYFPKQLMGTVIGSWTPFYGMGAILVHWVTGMIRDATGSYHFAFGISAVMAALGFFLFLMLKKVAQPSCRV